MMNDETFAGDAVVPGSGPCEFCDEFPEFGIYRSGAGFYIGYACMCLPWSRESGYYKTYAAAKAAMERGGLR